jgi:hypothetical protein
LHWVECNRCGCGTLGYEEAKQSAHAWNTRTQAQSGIDNG